MANLNLQDKKFITPENLKLIINYGLGFASRVKNLEDKEIAPFEADKLYTKDSLTIYDGYIYKAKVTNQSSTFNEIYWDLIGDDITELTKSDVEAMVGLTSEQITTLSSIILDSEIRLDKTHSSSKIYMDIQQCLDDSKAFTLTELSKMSGASYKVVTSTDEMSSESIIYLLANATNYDMYIVEEDGTATKIGNTNISLDDYFTKQEITDNYYDKVTSDGKYALITTVDNHISDTVAHVTSDERIKWNNKANTSDIPTKVSELENDSNFVGLNDTQASDTTTYSSNKIADLIAEATTGKQMITIDNVSEKEVKYFKIANTPVNSRGYMVSMVGLRINTTASNEIFSLNRYGNSYKYTYDRILTPRYSSSDRKVEASESCYLVLGDDYALYAVIGSYCLATIESIEMSNTLIKEEVDSLPTAKFTSYEQQSTTSVEDVGVTTITPINSAITGTIEYTVKNGICYVSLFNVKSTTNDDGLSISTTMPKPAINSRSAIFKELGSGNIGFVYINKNTTLLTANINTAGILGNCSFSYPVAES